MKAAMSILDNDAQMKLMQANPGRAQEIVDELVGKGASIRNPSAFVSKSLSQHTEPRDPSYNFVASKRPAQMPLANPAAIKYARTRDPMDPMAMLDDRAKQKLQE